MNKRGRPFSDNPRTKQYRILMNKDEKDTLETVCKLTGMSKADVFRTAIERMLGYEIEIRKEN